MSNASLDRLKLPATVLAACAALIVGFDLFVLLLNVLGYDVSILNQAHTVRRLGSPVRVPGLGLRGFPLFAANTVLLLIHVLMLGLALRVRLAPTPGWAVAAGAYSLLPCNCSCLLFPVSFWLLAAAHGGRARPSA